MKGMKMKKSFIGAIALTTIATPALAHHPLAGAPMETFAQGMLSGIGHPLLGFDHLFFVLAVGLAALFTGNARFATGAYIVAMLAGCLMMSFGIGLPVKEIVIGASLLVVGGILVSGRGLTLPVAVALFAAFGLFHGSAFGDSIAGQEAAIGGSVLIGYLIGLGVLQYAMAMAAGWAAKTILGATEAGAMNARLAGAVVAGMGLFLSLENAEGIAFAALGLA